MIYSAERLEMLHSVLLEMLKYIDSVCKNNNIEYYLNCGTALGAVRHKGFIPWDDDIDIMLPRESYNRLLQCFNSNPSNKYVLQNEKSENNYFTLFSKIRKKGTVFLEKDTEGMFENNGIYIDIFPLDFSNEIKSFSFRFDALRIRLIKHTLSYKYCNKRYRRTKGKVGYLIGLFSSLPYIFRTRKYLYNKANYLMQKRNSKERIYAISYAGIYSIKKETMKYTVYYPPKLCDFEGKKYPICNNAKYYLHHYYGDFMKLPPKSKRHTHEPVLLRFE